MGEVRSLEMSCKKKKEFYWVLRGSGSKHASFNGCEKRKLQPARGKTGKGKKTGDRKTGEGLREGKQEEGTSFERASNSSPGREPRKQMETLLEEEEKL